MKEQPTLFDLDDEPREPEPGAFVTLAARALAVSGIMESINLANKASGATHQLEDRNSSFSRRYQEPEEAASIMRFGAKQHLEQHFSTLSAEKAMIDAGFDLRAVADEVVHLKNVKRTFEGTGRKNVTIRRREAEKIRRTADR